MRGFWILDSGFWIGGSALAGALMLTGLGGCKSASKQESGSQTSTAPSYAEIAAFHNARVQQLQTTYSVGVIWADEKGQLLEQGNIEMWIDLPARTALRVEKLGEVLLWLGSDEHRYWLFDRRNKDERVLYLGGHEELIAMGGAGEDSPLTFKPLALIDLMGLSPLPERENPPPVKQDAKSNAWVVQATGRGGTMRLHFDRKTFLPSRVEALTDNGEVTLSSSLSRYESVPLPGVGVPGWPKMAELIDITGHNQAGVNEKPGKVRIAINDTTADFDRGVLARLFDLDRLMRAMRSDRVEGELLQPSE